MSSWDRLEIQGDFLFSNPNSFFGFIKGTSKNKVTQFFKASASPSASQQKFKFPMVSNAEKKSQQQTRKETSFFLRFWPREMRGT
jgi:hypothetical protein